MLSSLDSLTLSTIVGITSALTLLVAIAIWQINIRTAGTFTFFLAAVFAFLAFLIMIFSKSYPDYLQHFLAINNIFSLTSMTLQVEALIRFRGFFTQWNRQRGLMIVALFGLYCLLAIWNFGLELTARRYVTIDIIVVTMAWSAAASLVWKCQPHEKRLHYWFASIFLVLSLAFINRWVHAYQSLGQPFDPFGTPSKAVILAVLLWSLAWTYGLSLVINLRAIFEMARLARRDSLTDLSNRRDFDEFVERQHAMATRAGTGYALALFDLDRFKVINDQYGHKVDDQVLKIVAARLRASMRHSDLAARLGGDEFIVYLHGISSEVELAIACQRLRKAIQGEFYFEQLKLPVQLSLGAALFPRDGKQPQEIVHQADKYMFIDKRERKAAR